MYFQGLIAEFLAMFAYRFSQLLRIHDDILDGKRHPPPVPLLTFVLEPEGPSGGNSFASGFPLGADMHTSVTLYPQGMY